MCRCEKLCHRCCVPDIWEAVLWYMRSCIIAVAYLWETTSWHKRSCFMTYEKLCFHTCKSISWLTRQQMFQAEFLCWQYVSNTSKTIPRAVFMIPLISLTWHCRSSGSPVQSSLGLTVRATVAPWRTAIEPLKRHQLHPRAQLWYQSPPTNQFLSHQNTYPSKASSKEVNRMRPSPRTEVLVEYRSGNQIQKSKSRAFGDYSNVSHVAAPARQHLPWRTDRCTCLLCSTVECTKCRNQKDVRPLPHLMIP